MAITTSKLYAVEDAFVTNASPLASYHNLASVTIPYDYSASGKTQYFMRFEEPTAVQKRKHIVALQLFLYITSVTYGTGWQQTGGSGWDGPPTEPRRHFLAVRYTDREIDGVTYDTLYTVLGDRSSDQDMRPAPLQTGAENCMGAAFKDTRWAEGVMAFYSKYSNDTSISFQGVLGANKPYLLISMEDAELTIRPTPTAGAYLNRHAAAKLTWALATNAYGGPAAFTQASAVLSWRNGASGAVNSVDVNGGEMAAAIPADTFPSTAELQWKVNITFASGETAESDWATLTTIDSTSSCALVSPVSTFIDGSVVNRFAWDHIIATGTAQSAYDLQYSIDNGATWTDIASAVAAENQYCDVPADTLPAGTLLWRVRTYNADGVGGTWSASATIVVQAAPAAPLITSVTATPRPEIAWQSSGQQAYQVTAGDYNSGAVFGTIKTHKIPMFLPDGSASIRVRIQNEFGLWSAWAAVNIIVANAGSGTFTLSATVDANTNVHLTWQGAGEIACYYVYRDGTLIGKTDETTFTDHLAIGLCSYTVRAVAGDDYILSAPVAVDVACETAVVADVDTFDWRMLPYLRDAEPVIKASATRQVTYQHYSGRRFPLAEIAEYEDETYSFEYSFLDRAEAMAVRGLLGKIVAVKTPHGECYVGVLEAMPYSTDWAATDVAFTVRAVDYKDVIEYEI